MIQATKEQVAARRRLYPVGCRVVLIKMDDVHAPPVGTQGVIDHIDDSGTAHVRWATGSGLGAVYGVDIIERIETMDGQKGEYSDG